MKMFDLPLSRAFNNHRALRQAHTLQTWTYLQRIAIVFGFALATLGCNKVSPDKTAASGNPAGGAAGIPTDTAPPRPSSGPRVNDSLSGSELPANQEVTQSTQNLDTPSSSDGDSSPESASSQMAIEPSIPRSSAATSYTPVTAGGGNLEPLYVTLRPSTSNDPAELLQHINQVDAALKEIVTLGGRGLLDKQSYIENGLRLGQLKLESAERIMAGKPDEKQLQAAKIAKLVALSHMSGLQDVAAAQQLNAYAKQLAQSEDPSVAHQGRVVLLGFEVQNLQSGISKAPDVLLESCRLLLDDASQRNFPEFLAVQNAANVMANLGHIDAAEQTVDILSNAYLQSTDSNLRGEAWMLSVRNSSTANSFFDTLGNTLSGTAPLSDIVSAARRLVQSHPNGTTIEKLASTLGELDAASQFEASRMLAQVIHEARQTIATQPFQDSGIDKLLSAHQARQQLLGSEISFVDLVDFDGNPATLPQTGKVVLVEFWASWCVNCITEIPHIREAHERFASQGLEVIGINMDENLEAATNFLTQRRFPWTNLHSADTSRLGFKSVIAERFGVERIPFTILIGRDGKVAAINVRGKQLVIAVEDLLASGAVAP